MQELADNGTDFRGIVLLKAGTYRVSDTITIQRSGIAIRGEGMDRTIILASGRFPALLKVT
jgi:hypothetical protein